MHGNTSPLVYIFSQTSQEASNSTEDLQSCLRLARSLNAGKRPLEALQLIEKNIHRSPGDVELLHLRGLCLEASNNGPAAFATYMSVLNINPKHAPSLCCVGAMYKARGMLQHSEERVEAQLRLLLLPLLLLLLLCLLLLLLLPPLFLPVLLLLCQEAMSAYAKALEVQPGSAAIQHALAALLTDLGTQAKGKGASGEALDYYQRAIEMAPTYAPAFYNLGVLHSECKQFDVALDWYQKAISVQPNYAEAHCNMGVIYKDRGDLEAAIACYESALEASPNFAIVKGNLAIALTDLGTRVKLAGRLAEGCALYERALAHNPKYADALYNLGVAYGESGELDKAVFMYETAVQYNPACAEAHNNLGVIYKSCVGLLLLAWRAQRRENLEKAMECYAAALTVKPDFPQSLNNMGVIYTAQGRAQEALTLLTAAITACPTYAEAHNNLGVLQRDVGAITEAGFELEAGFSVVTMKLGDDTQAHAHATMALVADDASGCDMVDGALASYSRCLELAPDSRNAGQNRLLALNYTYSGEEGSVCSAHAEWGKRFAGLFPPLPPIPAPQLDLTRDRPLRVAYVSPDFFTHSVSYFAEAPLTHHLTPKRHAASRLLPPQGSAAAAAGAGQQGPSSPGPCPGEHEAEPQVVQHVVYCCAPKHDSKTTRLRNAVEAAGGTWREVTQLSEPDLARLVREDRIDILVELTGHTANNRLGTMAMQPAPIQATWIGYPNTTGLTSIQYRITDAICDPHDTSQVRVLARLAVFVEELVRLPGCFLCYSPAQDAPPVAPGPAETAGFVTFGSFNNLAKITPLVLKLWAQILKTVPRSRLVLKNKPFACDTARAHVLTLLAAEGIESWRVDLLPLAASNAEHLATYSLMDISLDPFPYAGTTTTCESLYMGVPCLTLAGHCHAHNVGLSLLTAVGLAQGWVARSEDEYVRLAVQHAADVAGLVQLRGSLRQRMLSSPLCDGHTFVRQLEHEYRRMWHRYVAEQLGEEALVPEERPARCRTPASADEPGRPSVGSAGCSPGANATKSAGQPGSVAASSPSVSPDLPHLQHSLQHQGLVPLPNQAPSGAAWLQLTPPHMPTSAHGHQHLEQQLEPLQPGQQAWAQQSRHVAANHASTPAMEAKQGHLPAQQQGLSACSSPSSSAASHPPVEQSSQGPPPPELCSLTAVNTATFSSGSSGSGSMDSPGGGGGASLRSRSRSTLLSHRGLQQQAATGGSSSNSSSSPAAEVSILGCLELNGHAPPACMKAAHGSPMMLSLSADVVTHPCDPDESRTKGKDYSGNGWARSLQQQPQQQQQQQPTTSLLACTTSLPDAGGWQHGKLGRASLMNACGNSIGVDEPPCSSFAHSLTLRPMSPSANSTLPPSTPQRPSHLSQPV
ncbi:hypothetical protein QJQ45_029380 [Haematococcus lacustris]|nr:hypothetical protein QJQ45_029380 [Haematococcus lacustris]